MFQSIEQLIRRQAVRDGVALAEIPEFDEIEIKIVDFGTAVKDGKATVIAVKQEPSIRLRQEDE